MNDSAIDKLPNFMTHQLLLRPNYMACLTLPTILSQKEVDRLSTFMGTLVMEQPNGQEVPDEAECVQPTKNGLNPRLTFENFVESNCNRLACTSARRVVTEPTPADTPLCIYGDTGLGKTHLLHAVGNKLLEEQPSAKVLYVHAEQFVSDVVEAYKRKNLDAFRNRYHALDLLLIDDVQFIANKDRTQEQLFNTLESLFGKNARIIITACIYPGCLEDINEPLKSRFEGGLSVGLEGLDFSTQLAILNRKAQDVHVDLSQDVALYIVGKFGASIRTVESVLRLILAHAQVYQKEITLELVKEAVVPLL